MGLAPERAQLISARDLSRTVEAAVRSASARVAGAETAAGPVIVKWELVGRRARNLAQGEQLAAAITEELGKSGLKAQPAVLGIGKEIICGFFEPANIPIPRNF